MREFFIQNETIILFAQGLVFFSLGFAVWLQRRRATRLTLSSSLIWLAGFAFVEALAVWGYVFVPIQEGYMGEGLIEGLLVLRGLVQIAAFVFLVQFGLRLLGLVPARCGASLTVVSILVAVGIVGGHRAGRRPPAWSAAGVGVGGRRARRGTRCCCPGRSCRPWGSGASAAELSATRA